MQKGFWLEKNNIKNIYPYLSRNVNCNVLIVGGGICGAITAYFLAKEGFKVVIIEKNIIGHNNTSFSSACVTEFMDDFYMKIPKENDNLKRKLCDLKKQANTLLDEILVNMNKGEYLSRKEHYIVTPKMFQKSGFQSECNFREKMGEKAIFFANSDLFDTSSGIQIKDNSAILDSYDFTSRLFEYLASFPNVSIYENTEMQDIYSNYEGVVITTQNDFLIKSDSMILTSDTKNIPLNSLPNVERYKRFSMTVKTDLNKDFSAKIINDIPIYIRGERNGNIVISGLDTKYIFKMESDKYLDSIKAENLRKFKYVLKRSLKDVNIDENSIKIYAGDIMATKDNLPIISEIDKLPNCYLNLGVGSTSIANFLIGGDTLKDAIKGYYKKDMNIFKMNR